jgi:sugar (pentulose or hexulose) kinase
VGSRNTIWNQIKANILDTTIHIPNVKEASALGAALLAALAQGIYKDFNEAGVSPKPWVKKL